MLKYDGKNSISRLTVAFLFLSALTPRDELTLCTQAVIYDPNGLNMALELFFSKSTLVELRATLKKDETKDIVTSSFTATDLTISDTVWEQQMSVLGKGSKTPMSTSQETQVEQSAR